MMNFNQNHNLKIGNAPCSWGVFYPENNSLKYDKYLTKISEIGYQYSELGPLGYFNDEASIIKDFLIKLNIQISGAAHVHNFADLSMFDKLRLDVNTISDYNFIKDIYDNLYSKKKLFRIQDVIKFLTATLLRSMIISPINFSEWSTLSK